MRILLSPKVDKALLKLVHSTPREWSAFAKTEPIPNGVRLVDLRIPFQESSMATTELSEDDLYKFFMELEEANESPKDWNCWVHSHNTMRAFWSKTDTDQMQSFNNGGPDHFFHLVVSTTGRKGAFTSFKPFIFENLDIPVEVERGGEEDLSEQLVDQLLLQLETLEKEFKEKREELEFQIEEAEFLPFEPFIQPLLTLLSKRNKEPVYTSPWNKNGKGKQEEINWDEDEEMVLEEWRQTLQSPSDHTQKEGFYINNRYISYETYASYITETIDHAGNCPCNKCDIVDQFSDHLREADKPIR